MLSGFTILPPSSFSSVLASHFSKLSSQFPRLGESLAGVHNAVWFHDLAPIELLLGLGEPLLQTELSVPSPWREPGRRPQCCLVSRSCPHRASPRSWRATSPNASVLLQRRPFL